ncbi:MAG: hypothetical protein QOK40_2652 [Miltoncostaeaceae bacterium]|jgi:acyl-CoA synthetase (NDP forming)|nr:hypothetical protein [Miltoncostaeaceae bacterium]
MAAPPGPEGFGLIALSAGEPEQAVALARYERAPGASEAELAVAVDDRWQGLGLGTGLIERLLARAADDGLDALWATVLPRNRRMQTVFRDLGANARVTAGRDEVLVRLPTRSDEGLEEAQIGRFAALAAASLEPLFRPRAIAVVGASRDPSSPGGAAFRALLGSGFPGPVHTVDRAGGEVAGRHASPALAMLPEPVDLAVIAVPAEEVPAVAREAAACGVRAIVVLSSGFSETGPAGAELEARLLHIARTTGMRVLGPNCLGIAVNDAGRPFDATLAPGPIPRGHLAFASQSGGLGIGALGFCASRGIGLSAFASLGNKADISSNDLLAWWERDESTRAILLYLEGFGNPRRFARLARRVARTTPIVALKGGRGGAGVRAAGSHTAALAAGEAATDALFELAGVVRAHSVQELFEVGQLLSSQPLPAGRRVAILSNAGGPGILAADACEAASLSVPRFDGALRARLAAAVPTIAGTSNPVHLGAGAGAAAFTAAGEAIVASGAADALLVVCTPTNGGDPDAVAASVEALADGRLTVIGCRLGQPRPPTPADTRWPVPWLDFPEDAARTLALAARAGEAARRPPDPAPALSDVDPAAAQEALESAAPGAWLDALAVERLLLAYGLPLARARLVQEVAGDGLDLIVGATADPLFGPLVLAGIGGAQAELWRDSALALAPVGRRTAEGLWAQLRGARLLDGWRGSPAADRAALADVVVRIGRLAADQPLLAELDCNPVRALGPGRGVLILDARARRSAH